jgi:hypothetical protein
MALHQHQSYYHLRPGWSPFLNSSPTASSPAPRNEYAEDGVDVAGELPRPCRERLLTQRPDTSGTIIAVDQQQQSKATVLAQAGGLQHGVETLDVLQGAIGWSEIAHQVCLQQRLHKARPEVAQDPKTHDIS